MTVKQAAFVHEYLIDGNATEAAIRAGYSKKTARQQASRLLTIVDIKAAIAEHRGERAQRTQITADRVLLEITRLGLSDPRKLFDDSGQLKPVHEWDDNTAATIASVEVVRRKNEDGSYDDLHKVKVWDKNSALEKLAKILGMYQDAMQVDGKLEVVMRKEY